MEPQGAPQPDSRPAPFLHSMLQLSDGPWAQLLLPKLIEQGSAAAVALTCSHMRDLCCNNRQSLKLGGLLERTAAEPGNLKSWVQGLPAHFPNCSTVKLTLGDNESFHCIPYILPALARLPQLNGMSISLIGELAPLQASSMLYSMRTQLSGLQGLSLTVNTLGWTWPLKNVFLELVDMTRLTHLCLSFLGTKDSNPLQDVGMHQLSVLTQLQHLAIRMKDWDSGERKEHHQFYEGVNVSPDLLPSVYGLTALTRLETDLGCGLTLFGISTCTSLQHLEVCVSDEMPPHQWEYLAPLTRLTQLRLLDATLDKPSPEALDALSSLSKLQVVAAGSWSPAFLPGLAACAQLTEICGLWQDDPDSDSDTFVFALPQVLTLSPGRCTPPFECFPNLRHFRADNFMLEHPFSGSSAINVPTMRSLYKNCTGLRELVLTAGTKVLTGSLWESGLHSLADPLAAAHAANCTAAIQALTSLQHLTCLKFSPYSKYEMLALVQACSVLEGHSLQELHVVEGKARRNPGPNQAHTCLNAAAWSQLGRLHRLRLLSVVINCEVTYRRLVGEADVLLSALSGCGSVVLHMPGYTAPFDQALFDLEAAGVPAPDVKLVQLERSITAVSSSPANPIFGEAANSDDNDNIDAIF